MSISESELLDRRQDARGEVTRLTKKLTWCYDDGEVVDSFMNIKFTGLYRAGC